MVVYRHVLDCHGVCLSVCLCLAVQNERDRISVRRPSYGCDIGQTGGCGAGALSVATLLSAELLSRQVRATSSRHPASLLTV